ncbi:MAG: pyridoxal-phosphate dependent enzyme, partial [Actinomycetota bacterium]|nr:pyridoxal-phosphate dependent enzyme [Actinomycetota bacterium]
MITRTDVEQAAARIAPYVRQTPVVETGPGAFGVETSLLLKLEQLQHTGVFKPRGAFNRLLATPIPAAGVIAASGGNHAVAVAYAAGQLGANAELFVPASSPSHKAERVTALGAEVTVVDGFYAEAHDACTARQRETGALMVHAYDMTDVVAGQGTVGLELLVQAPG